MTDIAGTPLESGLIYEARLPLAWRQVETPPGHAEIIQQNAANEDVLRTFSLMEQSAVEHSEEAGEYAAELVQLDAKLNLALDLIGEVLARQATMPQPVALRLGACALEWRATTPPPLHATVLLTLYPHPTLPRALHLYARAIRVQDGVVQAAFESMSDTVRDWMEKMIFRHHRRAIALSRANRDSA